MAETFTKLFASILHSSIWAEPPETKLVWITMLALADRKGYVGAAIPGLAQSAGVTVEQAEEAITKFLAPDPYSRSKNHDGRRIKAVDRGWVLLNYREFRDMRDTEERRAYDRERKRRVRAGVHKSAECPPQSAQADADSTEAEAQPVRTPKGTSTTRGSGGGVQKPADVSQEVWDEWTAHRKRKKASITPLVLKRLRKQAEDGGVTLEDAMAICVTNGWQGFFPDRAPKSKPGSMKTFKDQVYNEEKI